MAEEREVEARMASAAFLEERLLSLALAIMQNHKWQTPVAGGEFGQQVAEPPTSDEDELHTLAVRYLVKVFKRESANVK